MRLQSTMNYRKQIFSKKILTIFFLLKMVFFHSTLVEAVPDTLNYYKRLTPVEIKNIEYKQDTTIVKLNKDQIQKDKEVENNIYSKIQNGAEKNYFTRKLYGLFFRNQEIVVAGRVFTKTDASEKFSGYAGKRINRIEIIKLKAFGQSVFDSTLKPTTWIENAANSLHIRTANFIIRNNLLFNEGDNLNPVDFAESEQLIRNLSFIEDANILVSTLPDTSSVDVVVITKDAWTIGVEGRVNNTHASQMELYDKNLGGLGLWLNGYLFRDTRYPGKWGNKGELIVPNLGGSFIKGDFWVRNGLNYNAYSLGLKRDFYSSKAHYGGGASFTNSSEPYSYRNIDSTSQISYKDYDYWFGRSFRVSRKDVFKSPHNFVISLRYISKYYRKRPVVQSDVNYLFHNKEYYLVGLSLTQQSLYKANLIYSFGSTEDIPTGFRIQFTSGMEIGEFRDRGYFGSELSAAELGPWGYLFASSRTGAFISSDQLQQATISVRSTYFSNLLSLGKSEIRQFVKLEYTRGLSRFDGEGELILLDKNHGVRGLTSYDMSGVSRFIINLETVAFSPLYVFGFRFAYFAFCDIGYIGSADNYIFDNQAYRGYGIGVRIRNENLVLNTFQIRFGYYPKLPMNPDVSYWLISGEQRSTFENFRAKEPQIIPFE